MSWIKLIAINILIFFIIIYTLEFSAGIGRIAIGKKMKWPISTELYKNLDVSRPDHPCIEMKTDTLLSHVPNKASECFPKGGVVLDEYVAYKVNSEDAPVILTYGGSTTSGFYQHFSDGENWPKILATLIGDNFRILNGGIGGYSSLQDLYKFLRDGPRIQNLKYVVSLNGINELPNYHGANSLRKIDFPFLTETQYLMNEGQKWIDQRHSTKFLSFSLPNLWSLFRYFFSSSIESLNSPEISKENYKLFNVIEAADRWHINVSRLNSLVSLTGARYYVFLQPTLGLEDLEVQTIKGSSDYRLHQQLPDVYIKQIRLLYSELIGRCQKLHFCINLTSLGVPSSDIFSDARHFNAKGNKILAEEIYEVIISEGW